MTIKRRLSISYILMLIIPIILTMITTAGMLLIYASVTGNDIFASKHDYAIEEVNTIAENWTNDTDIETIKSDMLNFYTGDRQKSSGENNHLIVLCFAVVILIIFITNRILTRFVFQNIITPINTLVHGVHQVRDGNLAYRIEYQKEDEFADICSDFNEMAQRLSDMVNERLKDEANRKELIAGVSHDLRTPLTSIKAYVEGLEKGVAREPEIQKKYLDTIKNKTAELEYIINQLFMFSKIDIGEFPFNLEKISLNEELQDFVSGISEEYEKNGLSINYRTNGETAYVNVDVQQFRNALTNIILNSLKYKIREHGKLEIEVCTDRHNAVIRLQDDGPGVVQDAIEKLFNVFYRGDPSRNLDNSGSGLGLAITAKVLERLGGSIRAENAEGGGLSIIITLPIFTGGEQLEKNIDC